MINWKPVALMCLYMLVIPVNVLEAAGKLKIFVVSSYHPEYRWSQETSQGFSQALRDYSLLDNKNQEIEFEKNNYVESSKAVIQKAWMDTKRRSTRTEIIDVTADIIKRIEIYKPDIIFLGDDNAANYIGNHFIDTPVPVVFWGINGIPDKYGLIDSLDNPGHNITGIYQAGYLKENIEFLVKLVPSIRRVAILSDDSPTGRAKVKEVEYLKEQGEVSIEIEETIVTNSFKEWKNKALNAQGKVDAFLIFNHNTLKDEEGKAVMPFEAGAWYLKNIMKPDCGTPKHFVEEGILLSVDDSGYKQGYEAVRYAYEILINGKNPAKMSITAPDRGPVIVNRQRAQMLGIDLKGKDFIEEFIDEALALQNPAQ